MVSAVGDGMPQADHLTVFFASQTGNAESISRNIHEQAVERGFKSEHYVLNDHAKVDWEKEECLVFVVSTTGDGDPPDNSTKFWRHLRKLKGTGLAKAKYAILGLGDTNYDNFCQTAKKLESRLQDLGATPFYARGLADDAIGLEETVDPWIKDLWPALAHQVISAPVIHDLPPPHLTKEEQTIVEKLVHEHDHPTGPALPPVSATSGVIKGGAIHTATSSIMKGGLTAAAVTEAVATLSIQQQPPAKPSTGYPVVIDFSSMATITNLTALPRVPNANLKITFLDGQNLNKPSTTTMALPSFVQSPTKPMSAKINRVECLTPATALKRTLHVEFGFEDDVDYSPGDSFGIWAPNDESLVRGVLARLGVSDDELFKPVKLEGEGIPSHLQPIQAASLFDIFRYAVDLTSIPKKANIRLYADYATDTADKQKLMLMASKQGADLFTALRDQGPTLLDILISFPSVNVPLARVIETLPPLQPRYYSITSSPMARQGHRRWACAFNVVEYESSPGIKRRGVCTPWLDELSNKVPFGKAVTTGFQNKVAMFLKPNETKFNLPKETTTPVIMIGPGTGVAPFMGFLEHRSEQRKIKKRLGNIGSGPRMDLDEAFGEMWLFFGCRYKEQDWLFRSLMEEYQQEGVLHHLKVALSRETTVPEGSGKYVQDVIRKNGEALWNLIHKKQAVIYVCGDAKGMAKSVHDELAQILIDFGGFTDKVAAIMELNKMAQEKRYLRDLWA